MKIAIDGAFGTGKTTLVENIDYKNKIISTERELAKELNYDFNNHTFYDFIKFQTNLYYKQLQLENKFGDDFITDTSLNIISVYNKRIRDLMGPTLRNNYDLVFYLPIEFDLVNDNIRHYNNKFQKEIDNILLKFYKKNKIDYITITGSIQERIDKILKYINP